MDSYSPGKSLKLGNFNDTTLLILAGWFLYFIIGFIGALAGCGIADTQNYELKLGKVAIASRMGCGLWPRVGMWAR